MVVLLQVAAETTDSFRQHRNLHLRRPSVCPMGLMRVDQLLLLARVKRHSARSTPIRHYTVKGHRPTTSGVVRAKGHSSHLGSYEGLMMRKSAFELPST